MTHNPSTSVQIENTGTGLVRIFVHDGTNNEIVIELTFDDLDQIIGCGNAFGLAYQYLVSLGTRGYDGTIEAFELQNNPNGGHEELPDELTVEDIINWK